MDKLGYVGALYGEKRVLDQKKKKITNHLSFRITLKNRCYTQMPK